MIDFKNNETHSPPSNLPVHLVDVKGKPRFCLSYDEFVFYILHRSGSVVPACHFLYTECYLRYYAGMLAGQGQYEQAKELLEEAKKYTAHPGIERNLKALEEGKQ